MRLRPYLTVSTVVFAAVLAATSASAQARDSDGEVISVIDGVTVIYKTDGIYVLTLDGREVYYRFDMTATTTGTDVPTQVQIAGEQYNVSQTGAGLVLTSQSTGEQLIARSGPGTGSRVNPTRYQLD